ncbi:MAG TPA: molecular chaperone TorD family protein [Woeseiaceae bacterium]|nr:molecular chaperone TorD family protein [Woeseiaceae bacterium]
MTEAPATQDATAVPGVASPEPEDRLRADTYRVLGRLLAAPPDADTLDLFAEAPVSNEDNLLAVAWRMLAMSAERATPGEVADEYQTLFIGLGRGELVPFGSWYLTGFLMEQPLARLRADMQKLGFERQENISEPEDHAAALCEIMALLAEEGGPGSLEAQAAFFDTHIGPWMARFFRDMQEAASARFYRAVGQLGEQFINTDQRYLEMVDRSDSMPAEPAHPGIS